MNKILVVVYSCTRTSRKVAQLLAVTTREVDSGSFASRLPAFGTAVRSAEGTQSAARPAVLSPQAV